MTGYREHSFGVSGTDRGRIILFLPCNSPLSNPLTSLTQIFNISNSMPVPDNPIDLTIRIGLEAQGYRSLSLPMEGLLEASPSITIPALKEKKNCQVILSVVFTYAARSVRRRTVIARGEDCMLGNERTGADERAGRGDGCPEEIDARAPNLPSSGIEDARQPPLRQAPAVLLLILWANKLRRFCSIVL